MLIIVLMLCSVAVTTAEFVVVGLLPQIAADVSVSIPAAGVARLGSALPRRLPAPCGLRDSHGH